MSRIQLPILMRGAGRSKRVPRTINAESTANVKADESTVEIPTKLATNAPSLVAEPELKAALPVAPKVSIIGGKSPKAPVIGGKTPKAPVAAYTSQEELVLGDSQSLNYGVVIPGVDRFVPWAITIFTGDLVTWSNNNSDQHSIVSIDAINSATVPIGINQVILPGHTFTLQFDRPGLWAYYCRFHAQLDASNQPIAPGPNGGIPGTPMMGVVTILPRDGRKKHKDPCDDSSSDEEGDN